MSIKFTPPLENYHSYPMVMIDGSIEELCHINGCYFTLKAINVSEKVSYIIINVGYSRTTI
jgi:hypothetical protein